jgi:hypothetical protein
VEGVREEVERELVALMEGAIWLWTRAAGGDDVGQIILLEKVCGVKEEVKSSARICWRIGNGTLVGLGSRSETSFSRYLSSDNMESLAV